MSKYSEISNQEISKIFVEKQNLTIVENKRASRCDAVIYRDPLVITHNGKGFLSEFSAFDNSFCFMLIERHNLQLKKENGLWWCRKFSCPREVNNGAELVYGASNECLKRAILECVLMIEDIGNE